MCKEISCCSAADDHNLERENLHPIENRKCRDVIWLLIFIAAIGGSIAVSHIAVQKGDLNVLKYGISSNNTLCGAGSEANYEKLLFCFNSTSVSTTSIQYSNLVFSVCAPSCPQNGADLASIYRAKKDEFVKATTIPASTWEFDDYLLVKTLCVAPSKSVLNRCVLDKSIANSSVVDLFYSGSGNPGNKALVTGSQMLMNSYNDISTTWYVILACGGGAGIVLSFIVLQLLRCFAGVIVWLTVFLFFVALVILDILLASKAGYMSNVVGESVSAAVQTKYELYYRVLFWIFLGSTVVFLFIFLFMVNRIRLAVALVREAADVMVVMPQILFTPLLAMIIFGLIFAYGIFISAFLASCGTIENGSLTYDTNLRLLILYHVFFCLWMFFLLQGLHSVVLAGAVSQYYWTRDKDSIHLPVTSSLLRTLFYHLGSIAFGSLILTLVRLVRWAMLYLSRRLKKYTKNNKIVSFLLCCVNCCLACIEKMIQFLTKNAYIMIAADGHSFCTASSQAWKLLTANMGRMTAVNVVSIYLFFLSKVGVGIVAAISASIWVSTEFMNNSDGSADSVSSSFTPSVCAFILGYLVSSLFFEVIDFTIDTLLLCFCLDDLRNFRTGNYFASTRLQRFMAVAPKMDPHEKD